MADRFNVRQSSSGKHGVWDHAVNGWHGPRDLSLKDAEELAATRNATDRRHHSQPIAPTSRPVKPAKPVVVQVRDVWKDAKLDWWILERDGWHGRVVYSPSGKTEWVHADLIRKA